MRTLLCFILIVAVLDCTPAYFDIWDAITHPPAEIATFPHTFTTRAQARAYMRARVPVLVREQVDDYLPMSAVKLALLSHYPNTNAATQALLAVAVPTGTTVINEVRYIAAFKREVQLGYPALAAQADTWTDVNWPGWTQRWLYETYAGHTEVSQWLSACYKRAVQIVMLMQTLETYQMPALAADVQFVRDSARVKLKEQNGFRLTAGRQNLYLTTRSGASRVLFAPLRSVDCRSLHLIQRGTAGTATCNIVPQGAVAIQIGTAAEFIQNNGVLRQFTNAEVGRGIRIIPIDPPTVGVHLTNQQVEIHTTQTITFDDSFLGQRLRYSVSTSQPSVALVRLSRDDHIIDITGVSAGNATITLTASNPAGNAVIQFIVTVVPRSDE